jgi:hypothetical protein
LIACRIIGTGQMAHHQLQIYALQVLLGIADKCFRFAEIKAKAAHAGVDVQISGQFGVVLAGGILP